MITLTPEEASFCLNIILQAPVNMTVGNLLKGDTKPNDLITNLVKKLGEPQDLPVKV